MGASYSSSFHLYTYDMFLSFSSKDTGRTFTDHLYKALVRYSIHPFRESETDTILRSGENIDLEIEKAIKESRVSIVVFSKEYASSRYCLNQLVKIMELKRTTRHIVLPVFYDVDPAQVRNQTDSYGEAFAKHEEKLRGLDGIREMEEKERANKWRAALKEAADLEGMVLDDRYEIQFIQNIVGQIAMPVMSAASCRRYWNNFLLIKRQVFVVTVVSLNLVGIFLVSTNFNGALQDDPLSSLITCNFTRPQGGIWTRKLLS